MGLLNLIDDYEKMERAYFGLDESNNENFKRIYEMSRIKILDAPEKINFRHIVTLVQIYNNDSSLLSALKRSGYDKDEIDDYLKSEITIAKYWLSKYAPDNIKFSLTDKEFLLTDAQKSIMQEFVDKASKSDWSSEAIHALIYSIIGERNATPKDIFTLFYRIFIDKDKGPRLGYFHSHLYSFLTGLCV